MPTTFTQDGQGIKGLTSIPTILEAARNPNFSLFIHERESQPLWKPTAISIWSEAAECLSCI